MAQRALPMVRFLIPTLRSYQRSAVSAARSPWILVFFFFPLVLYFILLSYETTLTRLIIPLFPVESDKSFGFFRDFLRLCFNEMLWLTLFLLLSWIFVTYLPATKLINAVDNLAMKRVDLYALQVILISMVCFLSVAYFTLLTFSNSADEYVYLYQAETLSEGKLWNDAPPLGDVFLYSHIALKDGKSVGRFPPGWPLLLSVPYVLGFPPVWLNPILAAISLLVFYRFAKRFYGQRVAFWSLISLTFTSFFIFNSASYFSHTACLLFVVGFVYCLYLTLEDDRTVYGLAAGVFLGLTIITRYYNAVLIFVPVLAFLLYRYKWRALRPLFLMGLATLPFVALLFWYNYKITGDGFLPVTVWADPRERLGFGMMGYTPVKGIEYLIRRVFLFLYWCSPALFVLYFIFLFRKVKDRAQRFLHPEDYFLLMMIVGYYFYHHIGGNQYGPRFWFEGLPFLILFVVKKTLESKARWPAALFLAGIVYCIVKIPYIIQREHQVVDERLDIYRLVEESNIHNAVVLVSSHTGIIRPMGEMDLTRNDLDYNGDVLYAHDRIGRTDEIMAHYPERKFYRYERDPEKVKGWLQLIPRKN